MLWSGFILGLLGSMHCIGMCGPIAFMLPVDRGHSGRRIFQISMYHLGRLFSYGIIGLIFGWLGKNFSLFGLQQQLSILIGLIMITAVFWNPKWLSGFSLTRPVYRLISKLKSALGEALKKKSPDTLLTIGILNGFLPCGLVYMGAIGSVATATALNGVFYMLLFGVGTIPMMTTAVYAGNFLNTRLKTRIRKAIPVFIVLIGILFVLRGMGLGIPFISPEPAVDMVNGNMNCH